MKKCILLILSLLMLTCGCSRTQEGCAAELRRYCWTGESEGGGRASLRFEGERAELTLQNGGETVTIGGLCLTDDETLVIFDEAAARSYRFSYVPKGKTLLLSYGEGGCLELKAE